MWILTQNGKRILSTEGFEEINVADPAEGKTDYAIMIRRKVDRKPFALGFYNRKDRAIGILEEIFKAQANYISYQGEPELMTGGYQPSYIAVPPKAFKMPLDT